MARDALRAKLDEVAAVSRDGDVGAELTRLRSALRDAGIRVNYDCNCSSARYARPCDGCDCALLILRDPAPAPSSPPSSGKEPHAGFNPYGRNFREAMADIEKLPPSERSAMSNRARPSSGEGDDALARALRVAHHVMQSVAGRLRVSNREVNGADADALSAACLTIRKALGVEPAPVSPAGEGRDDDRENDLTKAVQAARRAGMWADQIRAVVERELPRDLMADLQASFAREGQDTPAREEWQVVGWDDGDQERDVLWEGGGEGDAREFFAEIDPGEYTPAYDHFAVRRRQRTVTEWVDVPAEEGEAR